MFDLLAKRPRGLIAFCSLACLLWTTQGIAQSSTTVLPKGVWMANYRFGVINELSTRYDQSGSLQSIGRLNQAFSGENISKFSKEFKEFAKFLSTVYPHHGFVDQLSLGTLEFDSQIQARYNAFVLARGVTKNLTLAVGAPIVTLQGSVGVRAGGKNTFAPVCNNMTLDQSSVNTTLSEGCSRTQSADLIAEYRKALSTNGYQEPTTVNQTVVGDLQLAGVYQYYLDRQWSLYNQTTLTLPTGPADDPSNFLDVPVFHQTQLKLEFKQDFRVTPKWTLGSMVGYLWRVPDRADKRVPSSSDEMLPPASRQERVFRDLGDSYLLGASMGYSLTRAWSVLGTYEYNWKSADSYRGERGYDYSLLARDSQSSFHKVGGGLTFSTVEMFYSQEFAAPLQVSYTYSDVISGVNIDRQQAHELSLRVFF